MRRARNRVLGDNGHLDLTEFARDLRWVPRSRLTAVPIGRGVYIARLPAMVERRKGGQATTDELLQHAMRAMTGK